MTDLAIWHLGARHTIFSGNGDFLLARRAVPGSARPPPRPGALAPTLGRSLPSDPGTAVQFRRRNR